MNTTTTRTSRGRPASGRAARRGLLFALTAVVVAAAGVGDLVSATITGADGKLTADSIQDPASLPSAPGQ